MDHKHLVLKSPKEDMKRYIDELKEIDNNFPQGQEVGNYQKPMW